MTSGAQILHVVKKDLQESRWPIAVYWFTVIIATGSASEWRPIHSGVLAYSMFLVVFVGMVVTGSFVHSDSPIRADAFWATRPFDHRAMLVAKLCLAALVLVGPAVVGQAIALQHFGVQPRTLPLMLARSTWRFGLWVFTAVVVASFTRDLKTFVLALIVVPLVTIFIGALVAPETVPVFPSAIIGDVFGLIGLVSAVTLVFRQYAKRGDRRRMWVIGVISAAASLAWLLIGIAPHHPALASANHSPSPRIRMNPLNEADLRRGILSVDVSVEAPNDSMKVTIVDADLSGRLSDGTLRRFKLYNIGTLGSKRPPLPPDYAWLTAAPAPFTMLGHLWTNVGETDRARVVSGLTDVGLDGTAVAMRPVLVGSIPLSSARPLRLNGVRITLGKVTSVAGSLWLDATVTRVFGIEPSDSLGIPEPSAPFDVVLVNDAAHEAVALERRSSGGGSGWLVLPGAEVAVDAEALEQATASYGKTLHIDDAWIRQSRLAVYRWVPQYAFPIRVEASAPAVAF